MGKEDKKEMKKADIEIDYKNKRRYKTAKYPIRQPWYLTAFSWLLSKILPTGKKYKIEKMNMDGQKLPYMLLSNHISFIDSELCALATFPHRVNNVVSLGGYYRRPWLMEWIGAIGTRKFTTDLHLIKSIDKVLKRGNILCMYPEARYTPCGMRAYRPESLGKIVKMNKVPVRTRGYLHGKRLVLLLSYARERGNETGVGEHLSTRKHGYLHAPSGSKFF